MRPVVGIVVTAMLIAGCGSGSASPSVASDEPGRDRCRGCHSRPRTRDPVCRPSCRCRTSRRRVRHGSIRAATGCSSRAARPGSPSMAAYSGWTGRPGRQLGARHRQGDLHRHGCRPRPPLGRRLRRRDRHRHRSGDCQGRRRSRSVDRPRSKKARSLPVREPSGSRPRSRRSSVWTQRPGATKVYPLPGLRRRCPGRDSVPSGSPSRRLVRSCGSTPRTARSSRPSQPGPSRGS